jgi:hypothetical protein
MISVSVLRSVGRLRPPSPSPIAALPSQFCAPYPRALLVAFSFLLWPRETKPLGAATAFMGAVPGGSQRVVNSFGHGYDSSAKVAELQSEDFGFATPLPARPLLGTTKIFIRHIE